MNAHLTPRQIVEKLKPIYYRSKRGKKGGSCCTAKSISSTVCLDDQLRDEIIPKNILMIGPTGVGKTEIAQKDCKASRCTVY